MLSHVSIKIVINKIYIITEDISGLIKNKNIYCRMLQL